MSYEHGTTHYNLPQTEGSDTRDWFDSNEAFRVIDEALYSAGQTAEGAVTDLTEVKTDVQGLKDADTAMTGRVDGIESRVGTAELKIDRLQDEVIDDNQDLKDAICSIEEASATAAYTHATGEFFWYNETLYKATTNIAVGQQIVPDTNCKTTNITTELIESGQSGVEIDDTVVSATKVWSSYKTNNEISSATATKTGQTRYSGGKLQYYNGTTWVDVEIGGGGMPVLNYASPLHTFSNGNLSFTASKNCWLLGSIAISGRSGNITVKVDNTVVAVCASTWSSAGSDSNGNAAGGDVAGIPLKAGNVVEVSAASPNLHVFEEA